MKHSVIVIGEFFEANKIMAALQKSYEVAEARSLGEGIALIESELKKHCVSVILDLKINDQDGFLSLETIKSRFPLVEVICLAPDQKNFTWLIEALRLGAYAYAGYDIKSEILGQYLEQILDQFDIFKIAEKVCRENMVQEMDLRVTLALELLIKRRFEGSQLSAKELGVFFPIGDTAQDNAINLYQRLQTLENTPEPVYNVLLVEDDPEISFPLQVALVGLLNYNVTLAENIAEANKIISQNKDFQVAILDIGLPGGLGTDLIQPILGQNPTAEIIMLTSFKDSVHITNSFELGASDYLPKPFDAVHLQQVVSKATQRAAYKSFLPQSSWRPIDSSINTLALRLALLQELVEARTAAKKQIQCRELGLFIPSLNLSTKDNTGWISPEAMSNGVVPFLLEFIQKNKIKISAEEVAFLEKL